MNTRDIEAAAERHHNRLEREHNDPVFSLKPGADYQSDGSLSFNGYIAENKTLRAQVEALQFENAFLRTALDQRDAKIAKLEGK